MYWTMDETAHLIRRKKLDHTGTPCGRPRDLSSIGCLGMVLMWYRTQGSSARSLCMMFGQTSTCLYKWLKFGRRVLLHVLCRHDASMVRLPDANQVRDMKSTVREKYPTCHDCIGAADGLKILVESPVNWAVQEKFFNGWKQDHYVNCVFLFTVDGKIRVAVVNAPGSFHDSTIADYGAYSEFEKLFRLYQARIVVDSAFNIEGGPWLIESSQLDPMDPRGILFNREATSLRQLSEWEMRMLQAAFPRIKCALPCEEDGEREIILKLMVLLHNFASERMGLNQIFNSFIKNPNSYFSYTIDETFNPQ